MHRWLNKKLVFVILFFFLTYQVHHYCMHILSSIIKSSETKEKKIEYWWKQVYKQVFKKINSAEKKAKMKNLINKKVDFIADWYGVELGISPAALSSHNQQNGRHINWTTPITSPFIAYIWKASKSHINRIKCIATSSWIMRCCIECWKSQNFCASRYIISM